jgi:hypothetical protein
VTGDRQPTELLTGATMNFVSLLVALLPWVVLVDGFAQNSPYVICSRVGQRNFKVCATTYYATPYGTTYPNGTEYSTPYYFRYEIVQGLPEGTDAFKLSPEALKVARRSGISVEIQAHETTCSVEVKTKNKVTMCRSCSACYPRTDPTAREGDEWFIADCTNVPGGRLTQCESAALEEFYFGPYSGDMDMETAIQSAEVFFPLKRPVLPPVVKPTAPTMKSAPKLTAPAMAPGKR